METKNNIKSKVENMDKTTTFDCFLKGEHFETFVKKHSAQIFYIYRNLKQDLENYVINVRDYEENYRVKDLSSLSALRKEIFRIISDINIQSCTNRDSP